MLATKEHLQESHRLSEAVFDATGRTLNITVIREGFNSSRDRYYTESALRSGVVAFQGAQQFADHPTVTELRERPVGSINNWVASLESVVYDEASRSLRATAKIIDPNFLEKVKLMDEAGVLNTLGVSVRAMGAGESADIDGVRTFRVDEFVEGISVDYVTRPGAGGYVESRESATPIMEDDMSEAIADAERRAATAEAKVSELETKLREAMEKAAATESALEELRKAQESERVKVEIDRLIAESDLPEPSRKFIAEHFAGTSVDAVRAAIEGQKSLVKQLAESTGVREMGESATPPANIPDNSDRVKRLFGGAA